MQTIHIELDLNAPSLFVFEQLADHAAYASFPGVDKAELLQAGDIVRNGVGAVRRVSSGPFVLDEKIDRYEPGVALGYRVIRSRPLSLKHKLGLISIASMGEHQCHVTWHSEFAIPVPLLGGWLSKLFRDRAGKGFAAVLKTIEKRYSS